MNDREFIKYLQKWLPIKSREDAGVDFNLKTIHHSIKSQLKTTDIKDYIEGLIIGYQEEATSKHSSDEEVSVAMVKLEVVYKLFELLNEED